MLIAENYLTIFFSKYLLACGLFELQIATVKMKYIINTANRADWVVQETSFYGNILIFQNEHLLQQHSDLERKKKKEKLFVEVNICDTEGNSYLECS